MQYAQRVRKMLNMCGTAGWYVAADAAAWKSYEESARSLGKIEGCRIWRWRDGEDAGYAMERAPGGMVDVWLCNVRGITTALRQLVQSAALADDVTRSREIAAAAAFARAASPDCKIAEQDYRDAWDAYRKALIAQLPVAVQAWQHARLRNTGAVEPDAMRALS